MTISHLVRPSVPDRPGWDSKGDESSMSANQTRTQSRASKRDERIHHWVNHLMPGATAGELPAQWSVHTAGDLGIALQQTQGGIVARSLYDLKLSRELLAHNAVPLFTIGFHGGSTEVFVSADM